MFNLLIFAIFLVTILLVYGKLPFTFFQQDEWAIFANYIYWDTFGLDWLNRLFIYEQDTHIIPMSNLFSYLQFKLFGLNFAPYAWVGIVLHLVNSLLVVKLANLLGKNKMLGLIA